MIVYEVDVQVEAACAADYRRWLVGHVAQMVALPGFTGAEVFEVVASPPDPAYVGLCVHYRLRDEAALDDYLREHAARMRADAVARFGNRFQATRRVLRATG